MNTTKVIKSNRSSRLSSKSSASSSPSSSSEIGKNAARERSRVRSLRLAFQRLQSSIPTIPPDTKLSKLDVLILAADYISSLTAILSESESSSTSTNLLEKSDDVIRNRIDEKVLHPIKKWPMRSRLYARPENNNLPNISSTSMIANGTGESVDYNCLLFDQIDPFNGEEWTSIDLNALLNDDFNTLSSFPNLQ